MKTNNTNEQKTIINFASLFENASNTTIDATKKAFSNVVTSAVASAFADICTSLEKDICARLANLGYNMDGYQCGNVAGVLDADKVTGQLVSAFGLRDAFKLHAESGGNSLGALVQCVDNVFADITAKQKRYGETSPQYLHELAFGVSVINDFCNENNLPYYVTDVAIMHELATRHNTRKQARTESKSERLEALRNAIHA